MIKLIDHRAWLFWVVYLILLLALAFPSLEQFAVLHAPWLRTPLATLAAEPRVAALILSLLASLFLIKPVWRLLWRLPVIGRMLGSWIFPDLNGDWDIEIKSNWPIIDALRQAAKDAARPRVDVAQGLPSLSTVRLKGTIKQGWFGASLVISPSEATPLRVSRTVSFDLVRATEEHSKRVAWIFRQENREVAATDEDNFLGSALLEVEAGDRLAGKYWNNRSWRAGLNAAGEIDMRKRRS